MNSNQIHTLDIASVHLKNPKEEVHKLRVNEHDDMPSNVQNNDIDNKKNIQYLCK